MEVKFKFEREDSVMGIIGCQLDYIWNELQSRNGGHIPMIEILRLEDTVF